MNIATGGTRASNGKIIPTQAQRRLLRKFMKEKREQCTEAGIKVIRTLLTDFRKWAPQLNKLGPPMRSATKWKNCWLHYKRKRLFYEFLTEETKQHKLNLKERDMCDKDDKKCPKKSRRGLKVQQRKFFELLKKKRQESLARGDKMTIITTKDFQKWTETLNKLGHVYPVNKWKMTWKYMKRRKRPSLYFDPNDYQYYKEVGCGSSEEFFLSDDSDVSSNKSNKSVNEETTIPVAAPSRGHKRKKRTLLHNESTEDIDKDYQNLCRICLKKSNTMKSFVDGSFKNISYLDIYHECIGEAFKLYNFCSIEICNICEENLLNLYEFRKICLQTDTKLAYIESRKQKLSESSEESSEEDTSLIMDFKVESDEELDRLEERSIPEDIMDTIINNKDILDIENPLQEHCEKLEYAKSIKSEDMESKEELINFDEKSYDENLKIKTSISDEESDSSKESSNDDTDICEDDPLDRTHKVRLKLKEMNKDKKMKNTGIKERPNKEQIVLLRKLVAEKQAHCEKFGILDNRPAMWDFKKWTPQLNALGPPVRPLKKWKDCWYIHKKKKTGFFDFINRNRRKARQKVSKINLSSSERGKTNRKQLEVLEKFVHERRETTSEDRVPIYTKDFVNLRCTLNKLGPPFRSVNEWKHTWRLTKKNGKKSYRTNFTLDVQELGCESSDAYYFTNESSDYSSDSEIPSTSMINN